MNSLVSPPLALLHRIDQLSQGLPRNDHRQCAASGPLGTSRMPVASTTMAPGRPRAKRAYQSITSWLTSPSAFARQGTMAGTQVRDVKRHRARPHRREQPRSCCLPAALATGPGLGPVDDALRRLEHPIGSSWLDIISSLKYLGPNRCCQVAERKAMKVLQPPGWPRPKGYSNGIAARGEMVFLAGIVGWDAEEDFRVGLVAQFRQALENILTILAEADARPEHIVRMTWYITSRDDYLATRARDRRGLSRDDRSAFSGHGCGSGRRADGGRGRGRDRGNGGIPCLTGPSRQRLAQRFALSSACGRLAQVAHALPHVRLPPAASSAAMRRVKLCLPRSWVSP